MKTNRSALKITVKTQGNDPYDILLKKSFDDLPRALEDLGCAGHRIGINRPIRCTVNPSVNGGEDYKKRRILKPCNVVVIGGGTAGLEAACTAAEVGLSLIHI